MPEVESKEVRQQIKELGPWFHNIYLPDGTQTAPEHFLGDFPSFKWDEIKAAVPDDLDGWRVLDIGCNAGFYSIELAKRGAEVLAIDLDEHYLKQARWVAQQFGLEEKISFKKMQVYDLAQKQEKFDLIWFMGVFYHLRYPLLALDILAEKTKRMMMFQTLTMPGMEVVEVEEDYNINQREKMNASGWPKMAFIEKNLNGDPTNWWAANHAGIEAMLRSCGFKVSTRPGHETYLAEPDPDAEAAASGWNRSEYLSAIGRDWKKTDQAKTGKK